MGIGRPEHTFCGWVMASVAGALWCVPPAWSAVGAEASADAEPYPTTAAVRIPLTALQGGPAATTWRANIARFRALKREWATWAPVRGGLQKPAGFGVWRRLPPAAAADR